MALNHLKQKQCALAYYTSKMMSTNISQHRETDRKIERASQWETSPVSDCLVRDRKTMVVMLCQSVGAVLIPVLDNVAFERQDKSLILFGGNSTGVVKEVIKETMKGRPLRQRGWTPTKMHRGQKYLLWTGQGVESFCEGTLFVFSLAGLLRCIWVSQAIRGGWGERWSE